MKISSNFTKIFHYEIFVYKRKVLGESKTGMLKYFDAITSIVKSEIFLIDSSGNFSISFVLPHPVIGSVSLVMGYNYFAGFYIEPGTNYNLIIKGSKAVFSGESGMINHEISLFRDSLYSVLGTRIEEADRIHVKGLGIEEYISLQKNIEDDKLDYLNNYDKNYQLSNKAFQALQSEIRFKTAHAWINYRYDFSTQGTRILRDTLPLDFYNRLFTEYPIKGQEDIQSQLCIDYISNIVSVLADKGNTVENRIEFIKSVDYFSSDELEFLYLLYSGDKAVINSTAYKNFDANGNWAKVRELYFRYNVNRVFENIDLIDQGLWRDLVVSQAISKNYITNNFEPTVLEWELVENIIQNKSIFRYLQALSTELLVKSHEDRVETEAVEKNISKIKAKYIDRYLGKVVYIDFYATWCSPCRAEIPYAKVLHYEFKNSDVVFLNLCAESRKEDWVAFIEQNDIEGENYLLSKDEMNLLSTLYKVEGFPTYILIGRDGIVSNFNAPRPSEKQFVIKEINRLLDIHSK